MSSVISLRSRTTFWTPAPKGSEFLDQFALTPVSQPIFSPSHQRLVGYEALIRVQRQQQAVPPPQLFEAAQRAGCTDQLDRHLLQLHLDSFAHQPPPVPVWLFLNISPTTCVHPDNCLTTLTEHCRHLGIEPAQVVLEVVETEVAERQALLDFVAQAKARGFQIAIDDFGVGDSNFERMWQLEPLIVKLDRSLLVNAERHPRARQLLDSLVRMIRESGSLVLLEGIETDAQARIALATDADLLQGFYFGRPAALADNEAAPLQQRFQRLLANNQQFASVDHLAQEGFLRLLRFETLEACHRIMRQEAFDQACGGLLTIAGVKRCFLLDRQGVQQGNLAIASPDHQRRTFNPLYGSSGACWAHREYVRLAIEQPQQVNACRPYVALPDATRTITLSTTLQLGNQAMIFCVDLHPDELFNGQLSFPPTL